MRLKKSKSSTRKFLNLSSLTHAGLEGYNNQRLSYYSIAPYNLAVLSQENIEAKIFSLMNLIKGTEVVEILCLNSRENFRFNKIYMKKRIEEEQNESVKRLLELDLDYIDQIQVKTATARSFLICVRSNIDSTQEHRSSMSQIEKSFKQMGFTISKLGKDDLKTMLAVYYEQNVTTDKFEDIDGQRWLVE